MTAEIINFQEYRQKRLGPDEENARRLAKKIVDAYKKHGDAAYFRAVLSATKGDNEIWKFLRPYVEEEATSRGD